MKYKIPVLPILIILTIVFLIAGTVYYTKKPAKEIYHPEAIDVTLDFYNEWLKAVTSTSTDPVTFLDARTDIAPEFLATLKTKQGTTPDAIFCRKETPIRLGAKKVFELGDKAEVMVMERTGSSTGERAIVSLTKIESDWKISNIICSAGEEAPTSEFSFEQRGALLKDVPAPLDKNFWHLVFTENNEQGHYMQLTFNASSSCTYADGHSDTCNLAELREGTEALVQGDATETGAVVKFMKLY